MLTFLSYYIAWVKSNNKY